MKVTEIKVGQYFIWSGNGVFIYYKDNPEEFSTVGRKIDQGYDLSRVLHRHKVSDYKNDDRCSIIRITFELAAVLFGSLDIGTTFSYEGNRYKRVADVEIAGKRFNAVRMDSRTLCIFQNSTEILP